MVAKGALLVDVRDSAELAQSGKAAGSLHIPRGSLEMKADLTGASADKNFALDRPVIVHCGAGGRAALAGKLLKDMGYEKAFNLGGLKDWAEFGGKVDKQRFFVLSIIFSENRYPLFGIMLAPWSLPNLSTSSIVRPSRARYTGSDQP